MSGHQTANGHRFLPTELDWLDAYRLDRFLAPEAMGNMDPLFSIALGGSLVCTTKGHMTRAPRCDGSSLIRSMLGCDTDECRSLQTVRRICRASVTSSATETHRHVCHL